MQLPNVEVHAALAAIGPAGPNRQVGLSTTPLAVTSSGLSGVNEPDAPSYARPDLPASAWDDPAERAIEAPQVAFPAPLDDWGTVVAWFLTDGDGNPSIPFSLDDGGTNVAAGSTPPKVTPRITSPLN